MISDELKVAWAAGFFDGEGTVTIQRRRYNARPGSYVMQMAACQKHPEALVRLHEICGCGSLHVHKKKPETSSLWLWRASGNYALGVLKRFLPHLIVKRDQAEIAIAFQERRMVSHFDRHNPSLMSAQREVDEMARVQIKALKHLPFNVGASAVARA